MTFKNFWAHRRQNGFVFAEIALITILSFYLIDTITVWTYSNHFCRAAGEFEKEHLLVGQTGVISDSTQDTSLPALYAFRDEIRGLPEVQSVCLTHSFLGSRWGRSSYNKVMPEADTTRICSAYLQPFVQEQCYFETMGISAAQGSPTVESLSKDTPPDGIVITRSLALRLFGTAEAVGRRMTRIRYELDPEGRDVETPSHHIVTGVVEDVKPAPHERHCYVAFFPLTNFSDNTPQMLIRLKPEADAAAFIAKHNELPAAGAYGFANLTTYNDSIGKLNTLSDETIILTLLGTLGLLFALNVVLGTLGTYWLQLRKRTEDIGIMRSFGAKRRDIFLMVWKEAALLTLLACILGQLIWLQFAINIGLADGNVRATSELETDWVAQFWLHYLVICVIQYLLMLCVVSLAIAIPIWRAVHKRPVDALRQDS